MKIVAAKADSYHADVVANGIKEVLEKLGGLEAYINPGERILLKPNLVEGMPPAKAVNTHPEVMRALIREVRRVGGIPLVGDSPGVSSTHKAAEKCGLLQVCQEEAADLIDFGESMEISCPEGLILKKLHIAKAYTQADKVISVAKLKTHTFMGITGATKNLFGFIVGMQKAQFHLRMQKRQEFASMLVDIATTIKPILSIVDGIVGMEGNGPRNGTPVQAGVLLAGENCFAVDVAMASIMGFNPEDIPLTALALKQGLTPPLAELGLTGTARDLRLAFVAPRSMKSLEDRVPKWMAELGRAQLTARPEIAVNCIGCGRCAAHCPPKAMTVSGGRVEIDYDKCIRCYCCQELCPEDAVNLREGHLLKLIRRL